MIATGNHSIINSLRGAPLAWESVSLNNAGNPNRVRGKRIATGDIGHWFAMTAFL